MRLLTLLTLALLALPLLARQSQRPSQPLPPQAPRWAGSSQKLTWYRPVTLGRPPARKPAKKARRRPF